jgi:hypothetical protein
VAASLLICTVPLRVTLSKRALSREFAKLTVREVSEIEQVYADEIPAG